MPSTHWAFAALRITARATTHPFSSVWVVRGRLCGWKPLPSATTTHAAWAPGDLICNLGGCSASGDAWVCSQASEGIGMGVLLAALNPGTRRLGE